MKKIKALEKELKLKDMEIARLQDSLATKKRNGTCKSECCVICKNFMGYIEGEPLCKLYDKPACDKFEFNGCPAPNLTDLKFPTRLTAEYLLALSQKSDE